jgi:hypothetical protein
MTLDEFLEDICNTTLSNLYIGVEGQVELHPLNRRKIISHMNMCLKLMHSKLILLKKELIIVAKENVSLYMLDKKHSMKCGTSELKFIDDTWCDAFDNDLIKVLSVHSENGLEFDINKSGSFGSVHMASWNTIQLSHPVEGQGYSIIYQAQTPVLKDGQEGCTEFNLPPMLYEALQSYVAAKIFKDIGGEGNSNRAQENMAIYDLRMMEAMDGDLASTSQITLNEKGARYGFV